jgi:hypothetical protein
MASTASGRGESIAWPQAGGDRSDLSKSAPSGVIDGREPDS